jgi:hypothetical protein
VQTGNPAMKNTFSFLFFVFAFSTGALAQLRWEKPNQDFKPSVSDTEVVVVFAFKNDGKKPVKITEVTTSCGCTTATMEKDTYAAGEKGKITATFQIGGRTGPQEKHVYVKTNAGKDSDVLTFTVNIPKLLTIDPIFVNWLKGEDLKPKTVSVKVLNNFPVHELKITSTSRDMTVEVKHAEGGHDFQLILTPKPKASGFSAGIEISPDFPKNPPKYFQVYTRVDDN